MTRISPKIIDVEGNRIYGDEIIPSVLRTNMKNKNFYDRKGLSNKIGMTYSDEKNWRFPTQLFCNIKNERFKYVKNI
jgi:hypothetical protein